MEVQELLYARYLHGNKHARSFSSPAILSFIKPITLLLQLIMVFFLFFYYNLMYTFDVLLPFFNFIFDIFKKTIIFIVFTNITMQPVSIYITSRFSLSYFESIKS